MAVDGLCRGWWVSCGVAGRCVLGGWGRVEVSAVSVAGEFGGGWGCVGAGGVGVCVGEVLQAP